MANINWDKPFHVDPATLQPAASGVPVPTYGNYGGPGYSAGVFVLDPDPSHLDAGSVDALDQQFLLHDQATAAARTPAEQAVADLGLLRGVLALDAGQLDAEASVYGGLTTLVMIERLAVNSGLGLLSPEELARAARDALGDIGRGLAGLDAGEAEQAGDWLGEVTAATGHDLGGVLEAVGFGLGDLHAARGEWLIS
jgi:hypothetical protein